MDGSAGAVGDVEPEGYGVVEEAEDDLGGYGQ